MAKPFAKLFDTETTQVVVMLGRDDETNFPKLFRWMEWNGMNIGGHLTWKDDDDASWDAAEAAFEKQTQETAEKFVGAMQKQLIAMGCPPEVDHP